MSDFGLDFTPIIRYFQTSVPYQRIGKICSGQAGLYEAHLSRAIIGSSVEFVTEFGEKCDGEVVGIRKDKCLVMPYNEVSGINSETHVFLKELTTNIKLTESLLGRVVDFNGVPIDDKGPLEGPFELRSIFGEMINPLNRPQIVNPLDTGIKSINAFTTVGKGQRVSIMAGSGVGKSVLLGMIARNTTANINVIALVGERGREVLEFIQSDLGEEGLKRSVVVVATSDTSPLIRVKAAYISTTIAEYFRDRGNDVVYMMDSITRFAMAHREIALASGEPPGQKGYSPSVFSKLPRLMERMGTKEGVGTITGIYTVLVENDDMDGPVVDTIRSIADGHIMLDRSLAIKNQYPAINILSSISRIMVNVVSKEHRIISGYLRDLMAAYQESEDLISVGAYIKGTNPKVDKAINIHDELVNLLKQEIEENFTIEEVYDRMVEIARKAENSIRTDLEVEGS